MADFRRMFIALAVVALFVGVAAAQVPIGAPLVCTTVNGSATPTVRSEGFTEPLGDVLISCTGGTILAPGSLIPTGNLTVFLNTQVTSRLLGNVSGVNASEALLLIDEPNSGLGGYGPTVPFTVCNNPGQGAGPNGCTQWMGNSTVTASGQNTNVPVSVNPNSCLGVGNPNAACTGLGSFNPALVAPGANVFQGVILNTSGNQVTFFGVPIMAPNSANSQRTYRITNLRGNANGISTVGFVQGTIQAGVSVSGAVLTITQSTSVVAFVSPGLTTSIRNTSNTGTSSGVAFNQCASTGAAPSILRYASNFGTAFKTRVLANPLNGTIGTQGTGVIQNVPAQVYDSESQFVLPIPGAAVTAGLADFGTRVKAVFQVPTGVTVSVSTTNISNTFAGPIVQPAGTSVSSTYAVLVVNESSPEAGNFAPALSGNASFSSTSGSTTPLPYFTFQAINNTVVATWEVINSNVLTVQNLDFGVWFQYSANVPVTGPVTVNMSYAPNPTNGAFSASSGPTASTAPLIPRFADTSSARQYGSIIQCVTALMFPYITTVTGFETGIAISNTTLDPQPGAAYTAANLPAGEFNTTPQNGPCTLWWFGNTPASTNPPNSSTGSITAGTTFTGVASASTMAGANFTGYMIATCNFQLAHGYAAISDVGVRNFVTSYLALVMSGARGLPTMETFSH